MPRIRQLTTGRYLPESAYCAPSNRPTLWLPSQSAGWVPWFQPVQLPLPGFGLMPVGTGVLGLTYWRHFSVARLLFAVTLTAPGSPPV